MSASVERVPHKPQESNEKDLIKNYLGNLKSAYQKKFFQNPGNSSSIPRAEAERHLELVYKRQQSSPHKVKTLVDYKDDMIEGLDPFQVHDFICKKELQEIEANASKFKAPSRRNNDRRREHLMTTSSINPSIQHLESKQNQLLDINKRGESSHKNVNENPQMRAYTLSHKKGRQVVKSNGLCFLNQSLIGNLPDKSCSPIRFAGQSVNSSAINYEEGSESPLVSNNNSKMQQQNSRMKLQIRNSASNNLLAAIRKQNLRQNEKKKNEKLTQDSQPHQSQSEMSINLPDLKLNNDIKPIESNITNIEKEDIVFNPELEADTKEKEGIKTKTKPVIVQNQSELLRIKLEQVVLRNQARAKKPSTTLMNQIDAKLKLNKALNTSHRSMSVLNKNSKSHQNSSPNQLKSFGNDTFSLHLKNENFKEQTLKAGSEEKSDASPCYPKIRSQQETAKFSENHLKAYGLFAKNTTSVAHSSSQSPEIKKGSDLFGDCSPEDRRSILKKRSLLTKQEEVLITSQGELRTSGSITFDQNVRYQEFPKIASDQGITLIGGKRNSNFFKEGKGNSQLSTEHKTQESVDSRVLLKSLDKANSLSLAESKKSKAQNYQDITPQRRDVRYTSLEDDSPGGINRARNSLNLNSLVSFKNKDKMSESLIIEKAKCQSILNRSMDLSDDIHEIGYDIDKAMYTQGQRHEKVGDLLDILQKASYAHSGILQTVYHYNKANKLEYKNEQERMIKDYSDKKEREFVQKEIEEGKALKVRVRRALKRNIGRANKI